MEESNRRIACLEGGASGRKASLAKIHLSNPPSFSILVAFTPGNFKLRILQGPIYPKADPVASLSRMSNRRSQLALQGLAKPIALSRHASCRCCRGKQAVLVHGRLDTR